MIRQFQSWGPRFGLALLLAGCASMPADVERAEFQEPPAMERTLSQASQR